MKKYQIKDDFRLDDWSDLLSDDFENDLYNALHESGVVSPSHASTTLTMDSTDLDAVLIWEDEKLALVENIDDAFELEDDQDWSFFDVNDWEEELETLIQILI